jgi:hypothetical protein
VRAPSAAAAPDSPAGLAPASGPPRPWAGFAASVLRLPASVLRLPASVLRLPASVLRLPASVLRLPASVPRLPASVPRAAASPDAALARVPPAAPASAASAATISSSRGRDTSLALIAAVNVSFMAGTASSSFARRRPGDNHDNVTSSLS